MAHVHFFYVAPEDAGAEEFELTGAEYIHAVRVLRKQVGEPIIAVDGRGRRYSGPILAIRAKSLRAGVERIEEGAGEPRLRLTLAQGVPRGGLFDWVVEKGTEIGISVFQPMVTAGTVAAPRGREERWREKARAAMKQCGRSLAPEVRLLQPFAGVVAAAQDEALFIAWEEAEGKRTELAAALAGRSAATLLIGPEAGFTTAEVDLAVASGARVISLGTRRLRSETAALTAAVRLLDAAGELG